LIESLEGKRPYPRIKPPYFPAVLGLYMCPTIVNNVETLCHVKHIVAMGAAEYARLGTPNNTGTRIVSLSGDVRRPGYYEIEVGKVTLGELIEHENFGQGVKPGRKLKAVIPGGSSAKVLKEGEVFKLNRKGPDGQMAKVDVPLRDLPYDFDSLQQAGTMSGSSAIIVMDDSRDIVECLANIAEFYAHESCGQCTPCREGSLWMAKALHRLTHGQGRREDAEYLTRIATNIQGRTICAFGEACAWPVLSFVNKFKDEFEAKGAADEARSNTAGVPDPGRESLVPVGTSH
jgi:NADH-quinone oxidoreductase subunit F